MPLRLGEDVFTCGKINRKKAEQLASTVAAFSELIKAYGARDYNRTLTVALTSEAWSTDPA
jgi:exopolyphosphatase/pppGpp-phosphohydrolase